MKSIFSNDIAILDVTSKSVVSLIGAKSAPGLFSVKADVEENYSGFGGGNWFDKDDLMQAVSYVLKTAKRQSKTHARTLHISVPSEFLSVQTVDVQISLDRSRRIVDEDIKFLIAKGDTFSSQDYVSISEIPMYFQVDDSDLLFADVRNKRAKVVKSRISYVLCDREYVDIFESLAIDAGYKRTKFVSSTWSMALGLLESEQRDDGFMLINTDYLTTSVMLGSGDGIIDLKSFSLGGGHIAGDIYSSLEIPFDIAEYAKDVVDLNLEYSADSVLYSKGELSVLAKQVAEIVRCDVETIAETVLKIKKNYEFDLPYTMPIYITGESVACVRGAVKVFSEIFDRKVEVVSPNMPNYSENKHSSKIALLKVAETLR